MSSDLDHWLTKAEAAERLEMSERTLDRLVTEGKGPERRRRKRRGLRPESVFNPEDVEALVAKTRPNVAGVEATRTQTGQQYRFGLSSEVLAKVEIIGPFQLEELEALREYVDLLIKHWKRSSKSPSVKTEGARR